MIYELQFILSYFRTHGTGFKDTLAGSKSFDEMLRRDRRLKEFEENLRKLLH